MAQNARIRDERTESTVRIQIAATESHEADLEQYVRICGHRIGDGLQISLTWFAKHECLHVCTPRKIIGKVIDVKLKLGMETGFGGRPRLRWTISSLEDDLSF
jgi:hypothetical protein